MAYFAKLNVHYETIVKLTNILAYSKVRNFMKFYLLIISNEY